ncbi:uncharacterized protein [Mobula birostris]|uniref:uncharacterized protein isoform X1 n=2 Tax=Mobula birostris TaxID=1983395 RepID=UPI003B2824B3
MDDCDLKKLAVTPGTLDPPFNPKVTLYKVMVGSEAVKITVYAVTSDSGASYQVIGADDSKSVVLKDGVNKIHIEVAAEDGTLKQYTVQAIKLTSSTPLLSGLKVAEKLELDPAFSMSVYEYTCLAPLNMTTVNIQPTVPDNKMQVTINGSKGSNPIQLSVGNTKVEVNVTSADGTQSQIYRVIVAHAYIPWSINFVNESDAVDFECPITLKAFYQPVSIKRSDPKHIFSESRVKFLTRKTMCDPIDETPFDQDWCVSEYELDKRMSAATVYCCFKYRGCPNVMQLGELGPHIKQCPNRPPAELDSKDVTGTSWYQTDFGLTSKPKPHLNHTVQVRSWEKNLHDQSNNDGNVEKLCSNASNEIKMYRELLSKSVSYYEDGKSPVDLLHRAAVNYALAIKLKPKDPELHFQLGVVLEEHYYVNVIYGVVKMDKEDDPEKLSAAEIAGRDDEILAICKLHGKKGTTTIEQLKALDLEYHYLKEQGQSARADYIQTLYNWKSQKSVKDSQKKPTQSDGQNYMDWAFLKYMDASSLQPQKWQYNFHVGRLLLFQKKNNEALKFLHTALAQKPTEPSTRFYAGLVVLDRDNGLGPQTRYAVQYLLQGLEQLLTDLESLDQNPASEDAPFLRALNTFSLLNIQLLRGIFRLGTFLFNPPAGLPEKTMAPKQVLHFSVDLAAWALCKYPYRGSLSQKLEWLLLESHLTLLELYSKKSNPNEEMINKRCQNLSSLLKNTNIPICSELLEMQQMVCQLRVETTPCDSNALYMLGLAQMVEYDNESSPAKAKQLIEDACLSFKASISMENKPISGKPPVELTKQKWWQDFKLEESQKVQQQDQQEKQRVEEEQEQPGVKSENVTPAAAARGGSARGRGTSTRGSTVPSKTTLPGRGRASEMPKGARGRAITKPAPAPAGKTAEKTSAKDTNQTAMTSSNAAQTAHSRQISSGINRVSFASRLGLARALTHIDETSADAQRYYNEVIKMAPEVHDAYIELANLLLKSDPLRAVDIYSKFPVKPINEQTYDDAFITGEIVRLLMKFEKYDDSRLAPNLIAYGKVMGIASIDGYINILDQKMKTELLMNVYAGIHEKPIQDPDLQAFFTFKHWI